MCVYPLNIKACDSDRTLIDECFCHALLLPIVLQTIRVFLNRIRWECIPDSNMPCCLLPVVLQTISRIEAMIGYILLYIAILNCHALLSPFLPITTVSTLPATKFNPFFFFLQGELDKFCCACSILQGGNHN
jgi:hypothetical protein